MTQALENNATPEGLDGDQVASDLRHQLESVKARMRSLREGIEAIGNAPADDGPEAA